MSDETGRTVPPLSVARSKSNQRYFFLLLITTCCVFILFGFLTFRLAVLAALVFIGITIAQALRTYVFRTVFTDDRIEHSTMLGVWHGLEYSKIMFSEDRGESITVIGEDILGKGVRIHLLKRDGEFDEVLALLREKTSAPQEEAITR